jgi:SAM-dependent methyltransferase
MQEVSYWKQALSNGYQPPNPNVEIVDLIHRNFDESKKLSICDIGSGPLGSCNWTQIAEFCDIYLVDPLMSFYLDLLHDNKISDGHSRIECSGENVSLFLGEERFDIIYSRNALDHAANLPKAFLSLLKSLRVGGTLYIELFQNEAENASYTGLHQWNTTMLGEMPLFWNSGHYVTALDLLIKQENGSYFLKTNITSVENTEHPSTLQNLITIMLCKDLPSQTSSNEFYDFDFHSMGIVRIRRKRLNGLSKLLFLHQYFKDGSFESKTFRFQDKESIKFINISAAFSLVKLVFGESIVEYGTLDDSFQNLNTLSIDFPHINN